MYLPPTYVWYKQLASTLLIQLSISTPLNSPFSLPSLSVVHRAFLLCWKKGGPLHTANTQSKLPSLFVNFRIRHILKRKLWFWEIFIRSFASIGYFSLYLVGLALPFIRLFLRPLLFEPIFNVFPPKSYQFLNWNMNRLVSIHVSNWICNLNVVLLHC